MSKILDSLLLKDTKTGEATEYQIQDSQLKARVDNLIANAGNTDDNAELIDIRVGEDGTQYPTAGEAVRGQVSKLKSDLDNTVIFGNSIYFNANNAESICNNDLNTLPNNRIYTVSSGITRVSNTPPEFSNGGNLISYTSDFRETAYQVQIFVERYGSIYTRTLYANRWSEWDKIIFGSEFTTLSDNVTSLVEKSNYNAVYGNSAYFNNSNAQIICEKDLDKLPNNKIYTVGSVSEIIHAPESFENGGCLMCITSDTRETAYKTQIFISRYGQIYTRTLYVNIWTEWVNNSHLSNVKVLNIGDSIAYGVRNDGLGYIGYITPYYINRAVGGATISTLKTDVKNIPQQLIDEVESVNDYDVVISDGGVNDFYFNAPYGSEFNGIVKNDTEANTLDRSTVLGGFEFLCYKMLSLLPNAHRYFLLTHKTYHPTNWSSPKVYWHDTKCPNGYSQGELYDDFKRIASKYNVNIIDVYSKSMINSLYSAYVSDTAWSTDHNVGVNNYVDKDEMHPLEYGYKRGYVPFVREALKTATKI